MLTNNPLPVLAPERIPARANGYSFMLHDAQWRLDKNTIVGVGAIHDLLDATTLNGLLNTLSYYASNMSPGHTENAFIWFLSYVRTTKTSHIDVSSLINYRYSLDAAHEYRMGAIRGLLRQWYRLGYPGVSKDVMRLLDGWTLQGKIANVF